MATTEQIKIQFLELRNGPPERAIKFLMDQYGDTLYGIVLKIVREQNLAEEALQEGFVKIWKHLSEYQSEKASLFTWMLTIVRNTAIDLLRQENRHKNQNLNPGVYDSINHSVESQISDIGLMNKVNKLDPKYRELIDLIYIQGFTQQETADHLQMPIGTVKTRINAAIKMLRSMLATFFILLMNVFK